MEKIKLKSKLVTKLFGDSEITLEELSNIEAFLLDGAKIDFSPKEIQAIKTDLEYIFADMKKFGKAISFMNCPDSIRDYILKNAPIEDIFFEEHGIFKERLEKTIVKVSDEFKICIGDEEEITESRVYEYIKSSKLSGVKPFISTDDIELVVKYASLSDFNIKVNNYEEYTRLMTSYQERPQNVIISKEFLSSILSGDVKISRDIDIFVWVKFLEDLSDNELKFLKNNKQVRSISLTYGLKPTNEYTVDKFIELKAVCEELASCIDMSLPELERFMIAYQILGREIDYEFDDDGEPSSRKEAHNLEGGLFENSAVCEGYAKILEQVLNCVGIECKCGFGKTEIESDKGHAWNQVKIDGKWYNCDLTWDSTKMKYGMELEYCLQSDKEFVSHISETRGIEECNESYDREEIKKLIEYSIEPNVFGSRIFNEQRKLLSEIRGDGNKGKYFGYIKKLEINNPKLVKIRRSLRDTMER